MVVVGGGVVDFVVGKDVTSNIVKEGIPSGKHVRAMNTPVNPTFI